MNAKSTLLYNLENAYTLNEQAAAVAAKPEIPNSLTCASRKRPATSITNGVAMEFGWDNGKYAANIDRRQIPFELVSVLFDREILEKPEDRKAYGEKRVEAHGKIDGRLFVCVYTDRVLAGRSVRWIISLRKANKREVRKYDEWIEDQNS